jgi:phosphoenolpyruvate carboxykinase (ATP)
MHLERYNIHSVFGVEQLRKYLGVPTEVLSPRVNWNNDSSYYKMAFKLFNAFSKNFDQFESFVYEEIRRGGPQIFAF